MTLAVVGQTVDGTPVLSGVFDFTATYGLPIEDALKRLVERGFAVSWLHYAEEAASHGITNSQVFTRIENAVFEVLGQRITWR